MDAGMIERVVGWSKVKNTAARRTLALVVGALLFVVGMPLLIVFGARTLDGWLGLPRLAGDFWQAVVGAALFVPGLVFALWSVWTQHAHANGTPLPMVPTGRLLASGPFRLCRNPMTLGTVLVYLGMAVWLGSLSALLLVTTFGLLLVVYLKFIEEKELAARFGEPYLVYKQETPFIIPRLR
ncbi:MAG: isoprenylcysteine carboxylmethyltransferase family protein [Anaerolineae bacterium]|nr:isoprenylcysteine carboxylmethyltransferase family protein [Anaerolineae bacterium]